MVHIVGLLIECVHILPLKAGERLIYSPGNHGCFSPVDLKLLSLCFHQTKKITKGKIFIENV